MSRVQAAGHVRGAPVPRPRQPLAFPQVPAASASGRAGEDEDPCPEGRGLRRELQQPPRGPLRGGRDEAEKMGDDGVAGELLALCPALGIQLHQVTAVGSSGDRDSGL